MAQGYEGKCRTCDTGKELYVDGIENEWFCPKCRVILDSTHILIADLQSLIVKNTKSYNGKDATKESVIEKLCVDLTLFLVDYKVV